MESMVVNKRSRDVLDKHWEIGLCADGKEGEKTFDDIIKGTHYGMKQTNKNRGFCNILQNKA